MTKHVDRRDEWPQDLSGYERPQSRLSLMMVERIANTGSRPLLVIASDNHKYWIKTENNPHHQASLLAEVVVNNAARYLQVPVPDYALIELGAQQASAIYKRDGQLYESGLCFGSREVSAAQESRSLTYLRRDNNSIHGAGYIALWEWCLGEDEQLLYRTDDQFSLVAFDHGFWLGIESAFDPQLYKQFPGPTPRWPGSVRELSRLSFL